MRKSHIYLHEKITKTIDGLRYQKNYFMKVVVFRIIPIFGTHVDWYLAMGTSI